MKFMKVEETRMCLALHKQLSVAKNRYHHLVPRRVVIGKMRERGSVSITTSLGTDDGSESAETCLYVKINNICGI